MPIPDRQLMQLIPVPAKFIDHAWSEGASCLAESCEGLDELTGDQLKMILSRGERVLLKMQDADKIAGWGVIRIDQLPNIRVLFITNLVAHNGGFERFFDAIKAIAKSEGCSQVRCAAKDAQARLYRMKSGFLPVYQILRANV
jgi:hypothetical protein